MRTILTKHFILLSSGSGLGTVYYSIYIRTVCIEAVNNTAALSTGRYDQEGRCLEKP